MRLAKGDPHKSEFPGTECIPNLGYQKKNYCVLPLFDLTPPENYIRFVSLSLESVQLQFYQVASLSLSPTGFVFSTEANLSHGPAKSARRRSINV